MMDVEDRDARVARLLSLTRAARILTRILDAGELADQAVELMSEVAGGAGCALYVVGGDDTVSVLRQAASTSPGRRAFPAELPRDSSLAAEALCGTARAFPATSAALGGEVVAVPILLDDGPHGFFVIRAPARRAPWSADDLDAFNTLAAQVGLCLGNARRYGRLHAQCEQLMETRAHLIQSSKLAAMGSLLAGVAHELNNPLTVVSGNIQLLRQLLEPGPLTERADKIDKGIERCVRIVKNFLALARERVPERQPMVLNDVVEEAIELLAYPLRMDNVSVTLALDPNLPFLWGDPHQLHQVLVNLVTNAHQAMRDVADERALTVTTRSEGDRIILEVSDTGPGIPASTRARIFEPFFTTKPPGHGTGLGLSICQGVIGEHGGTLDVVSPADRGATFRIELPRHRLASERARPRAVEILAPLRPLSIRTSPT